MKYPLLLYTKFSFANSYGSLKEDWTLSTTVMVILSMLLSIVTQSGIHVYFVNISKRSEARTHYSVAVVNQINLVTLPDAEASK